MKIFVIGGTGLVGSYLLPILIKEGNRVFALTRNSDKLVRISKSGAQGIIGDIRNLDGFKMNLPERLDIIVLLAMPSIRPGHRITKKRKEELKIETNDFFRNSMDLAKEYNIPIILPSGTCFNTKNNETADETWPIHRIGLTEIGEDTDEMVNKAIRENNPKVIQLLYGKIYGNGGLFRFMYEMMKKGRFKIIGKGDNCVPNIHAKDAAYAIIKAIGKQPIGEKFIIADDTAVTQKDFTNFMADIMHKKRPGHIPALIIRLVLGKDFYEIVRMNCKVSNNKAKKILDWKPEFPSYKEGLINAIKEMNGG
ncbi:MAG: NAD(P)-dependent oxidoreductase [Chitinispirillia bacterium]|jgi:nucleoside-diphosphate-sugar epimerase